MSGGAPWLTLGFVSLAAVASLEPGLAERLVYERAAVQAGEPWRLLTAQWVHGSPAMALLDLTVVGACGAWLERRSRGLALAVGGLALAAVALAVHTTQLQVERFEGSSGLAAALFAAVALDSALSARRGRLLAAALLAAVLAKASLEAWTGLALAPSLLPPGTSVLAAAHLAGALTGVGVVLAAACTRRALAAQPSPNISAKLPA